MNLSNNVLALLPEYVLTVVGVLIMMAEPVLPAGASRRVLGWTAIAGSVVAVVLSQWQLHLGLMDAFSNTVRVDSYSIFFQSLIGLIVIVTLLSSLDFFEGNASHAGEYYALVCFGAAGMMLMSCATELLVAFIGLEISSITTYIMAGFRKGQAAGSESSIKYFLLGSFATAFFLYGIALTFGATGSTNIHVVAGALAHTRTPMLALLAVAMVVIGIGFKVSAAPFHVWTPDVYQGAPAPVVGLMSTAPKAGAFAVLLRFLFAGYPIYQHQWAVLLWVIAALSMTIGNLGALFQRDVKRMLAYSSIAHAGYLLVAFTALPTDGIAAAAFYIAAYSAMNVGAFVVITMVSGYHEQLRTGSDFKGLAIQRPALAAALSLFLLSMIGIPFTGGFFGKFYVFTAALHAGNIWLAILGLANSGIACYYYLRLISRIYSRADSRSFAPAVDLHPGGYTNPELDPVRAAETAAHARRGGFPAYVALAAAVVFTLWLGLYPGPVLTVAQVGAIATAPAGVANQHTATDPLALR